jgi:hypothetical protein
MTILSILIATTPDRGETFVPLHAGLLLQLRQLNIDHPELGNVELVVNNTDRYLDGGPSIGEKRDMLVKEACGKYLCFVDSDDQVSPDYVETLVRACHCDSDVCTFMAISKNDHHWSVIDMRLGAYNEQSRPGLFTRNAWHVCPVKSIYAKLHDFSNSNYGEDWEWFEQVLQHCKTEHHIPNILYQYTHSAKVSEADKITNYVQSE